MLKISDWLPSTSARPDYAPAVIVQKPPVKCRDQPSPYCPTSSAAHPSPVRDHMMQNSVNSSISQLYLCNLQTLILV